MLRRRWSLAHAGELAGVRTLFNCFHHFPPKVAAAILSDAVLKRRPIAIFEGVSHRAIGLAAIPLQLPALLLFTPFVSPFRWSRIVLTYLLPAIPFIVVFDGTMSMLLPGLGIGLTHLVGIPKPGAR